MRIGECIACQMGQHDGHVRVIQHAPEGGVGGAMCPCEGECTERGPNRFMRKQLDPIFRALRGSPR